MENSMSQCYGKSLSEDEWQLKYIYSLTHLVMGLQSVWILGYSFAKLLQTMNPIPVCAGVSCCENTSKDTSMCISQKYSPYF